MTLHDTLSFSLKTVASYRTRSLLIVLAMALGVAAVVVLTALGEGARGYVVVSFHPSEPISSLFYRVVPKPSAVFPGQHWEKPRVT